MTRLVTSLLISIILLGSVVRPISTHGQNTVLADWLPSAEDVGPGMTVIADTSRSREELAQTFADPAEAERRLLEWGWEDNVVRSFAAADGSSRTTIPLEISLHRFASADGAASALTYFASTRAASLSLAPAEVPILGDEIQAISGPVNGEIEVSVYLRLDTVVARITTVGPGTSTGRAISVARRVVNQALGPALYTSPQFGYTIEWWPGSWPIDEAVSVPGVADELRLDAGDRSLHYQARWLTLPEAGTRAWQDILHAELSGYAQDRAALHPGATIAGSAEWPWTGGFSGFSLLVSYTDATGAPREEYVDLFPLPSGDGIVLSAFGMPADEPWAGPSPPRTVTEDWAAAADDDLPAAAPWGLGVLAGLSLTGEQLTAAIPQTLGAFTRRSGPVRDVSPWPITVRGVTFDYADAAHPQRMARLELSDLGGTSPADSAVRAILNCCALYGVQQLDVRLDAPTPYVMRELEDGSHQLIWAVSGAPWVLTATAPSAADLEALMRALVSSLEPLQ